MPQAGERETIHAGRKFAFERLWTASPGGSLVERLVVRHPGAVCVLALLTPEQMTAMRSGDADDEPQGEQSEPGVVMIRNARPALGSTLWELPAGTIDPGETPQATAARELEEETGYRARSVAEIARFYTTPGMTDELMHAYVATDLTPVGQRLEPDESIQVHPVRLSRARRMIETGELMDAKSIITLLLGARPGTALPGTPRHESP